MSTGTIDGDLSALTHKTSRLFRSLGASVAGAVSALGPFGRRFIVTGVGAVLALGLGAAAASAVRLPPEIRDPAPAQDQGPVQDEPPSISAARANALANPPPYAVDNRQNADPQASDAAVPAVAVADVATEDERPATVAYSAPATDADDAAQASDRAAPAQPSSSSDDRR